jgi:hypothetical protein
VHFWWTFGRLRGFCGDFGGFLVDFGFGEKFSGFQMFENPCSV